MPMSIRLAVESDEKIVTTLASEFSQFGDYVPVFLRMLHRRHPIGYGVGQDVELFVQLDGTGTTDGFAAVEWHTSHTDIHGIAVHPSSRRRGVAANLLDHVARGATASGLRELRCNTAAQANPAALGFFTTRGFGVVGQAPFNFPRGQAAVRLRRRLA